MANEVFWKRDNTPSDSQPAGEISPWFWALGDAKNQLKIENISARF